MTVSQNKHNASNSFKTDGLPPSCNTGGEKIKKYNKKHSKIPLKSTFCDTFHLVWRDGYSKRDVYSHFYEKKTLREAQNNMDFDDFLRDIIFATGAKAIEYDNLLASSRLELLQHFFTVPLTFTKASKGLHGYTQRMNIEGALPSTDGEVGEGSTVSIGVLCYGGNNDTCLLQVSGTGCPYVDYIKLQQVYTLLERDSAKPRFTRIDIACDFHEGEVTMEKAVRAYKRGDFKTKVQPTHSTLGDWMVPGSPKGRTLYVGDRKNSKMARIYEKGKQLGDPTSKWVRVEIEFKRGDADLDISMLLDPTPWFVGAYPWCAKLVQSDTSKKLTYTNIKVAHEIDHQIKHAKRCYGKLFNQLLIDADGDLQAWTRLVADGLPRKVTPHVGPVPSVQSIYDELVTVGDTMHDRFTFAMEAQAYCLDAEHLHYKNISSKKHVKITDAS